MCDGLPRRLERESRQAAENQSLFDTNPDFWLPHHSLKDTGLAGLAQGPGCLIERRGQPHFWGGLLGSWACCPLAGKATVGPEAVAWESPSGTVSVNGSSRVSGGSSDVCSGLLCAGGYASEDHIHRLN